LSLTTAYIPLVDLLHEVRNCRACEAYLPLGPRPIIQVSASARILIVGQAPGKAVHESGIPWDDASGESLRRWMGVTAETFYDSDKTAIIPIGYCYPGRGKSGDLPPRRECAELWLDKLLAHLPKIRLTLLVGQYAQKHFLGSQRKPSLTATVESWNTYAPGFFPLPHPSPRNTPWLRRHPWFEERLLPELHHRVAQALND
jgi:uracil-DNA glycosylase